MEKNNTFDKKYAKYYDLFNNGKDYSKECEFLDQIFKKYSVNKVQTVLDLGCGTGIHAKNLSERGYNISGLDLSEEMLKIARLREIPNAEFYLGDMSQFDLNQKFDATISMFAAFGYLTQNNQINSALKSIRQHLNPGGLFILDIWNGLGVLKQLPESRIKETKNKDYIIKRTSYPNLKPLEHLCEVKFDVQISKNKKIMDEYEENHKMRFFFPLEIQNYLNQNEFEVLETCKLFELGKKLEDFDWNMSIIAKYNPK